VLFSVSEKLPRQIIQENGDGRRTHNDADPAIASDEMIFTQLAPAPDLRVLIGVGKIVSIEDRRLFFVTQRRTVAFLGIKFLGFTSEEQDGRFPVFGLEMISFVGDSGQLTGFMTGGFTKNRHHFPNGTI
jgi:hypothetical protein